MKYVYNVVISLHKNRLAYKDDLHYEGQVGNIINRPGVTGTVLQTAS